MYINHPDLKMEIEDHIRELQRVKSEFPVGTKVAYSSVGEAGVKAGLGELGIIIDTCESDTRVKVDWEKGEPSWIDARILTKLSGYRYLIGRPLSEVPDVMYDRWPEVDHDGIITAILDGDCIPDNALLIDGFNDEGEPIIVDGTAGFMAVLRV